MRTAHYVRTLRECDPNAPGRPARQVLFRLTCSTGRPDMFVVASAVYISAGPFTSSAEDPEVYFFQADSEGNILSWTELKGSQKDTLDIQKCLTDVGYKIVGWREDIADDYVAAVKEAFPWTPQRLQVHNALDALRERVREAELQGYRRGINAARKVWKRRAAALVELNNTSLEIDALIPER